MDSCFCFSVVKCERWTKLRLMVSFYFLYVELLNHLDVKNIVCLGLFAFGTRLVRFPGEDMNLDVLAMLAYLTWQCCHGRRQLVILRWNLPLRCALRIMKRWPCSLAYWMFEHMLSPKIQAIQILMSILPDLGFLLFLSHHDFSDGQWIHKSTGQWSMYPERKNIEPEKLPL